MLWAETGKVSILLRRLRFAPILRTVACPNLSVICIFKHAFVGNSPANTTDCSRTSVTATSALSGSLATKGGWSTVRHTLKLRSLDVVERLPTVTPLFIPGIASSAWVKKAYPQIDEWSHGVVITNSGLISMTIFKDAVGLLFAHIRHVTRPSRTRRLSSHT